MKTIVENCCKYSVKNKKNKLCMRKSDKKIFKLPRRFTRKDCIRKTIRGYSMRSSCSPYKDCVIKL